MLQRVRLDTGIDQPGSINLANIKVHPLFNQWHLAPNVWRIEEKYFDSWNLANIYFVKGTDADLLVDTGIGVHYLPSYLLWSKVIEIFRQVEHY